MKDGLVLVVMAVLYSAIVMSSGFVLGAKFVWNRLEVLKTKAYVEGIKDCEEFHRREAARDTLQGEEKRGRIN